MTNPAFPVLSRGQDSKFYTVTQENPALSTKIEGGYVVSRPKHTRKPRKTFTTGFTGLSTNDRATLQAFYDTVRGGSMVFDWQDPITLNVYQVRFQGEDGLQFKYVGMGNQRLWDVSFSLQQA